MALTFYARDKVNRLAWRFHPSVRWWNEHDNGCSVSIGFTVGEDITMRQLRALRAVPVEYEVAEHSGCQSACVRRGDAKCTW